MGSVNTRRGKVEFRVRYPSQLGVEEGMIGEGCRAAAGQAWVVAVSSPSREDLAELVTDQSLVQAHPAVEVDVHLMLPVVRAESEG